jgi:hypothetical protein
MSLKIVQMETFDGELKSQNREPKASGFVFSILNSYLQPAESRARVKIHRLGCEASASVQQTILSVIIRLMIIKLTPWVTWA